MDDAGGTHHRIAAAAVVVVARDGFDVLSVRTVAREAGVSAGAVQHHFPSRTLLLAAAFQATVQSITARVAASDVTGPVDRVLSRLCREALPLDAQRRQECAVWAVLSAAAATHPELAAEHRAALDAFTTVVEQVLVDAQAAGEVSQEVDPACAAALLLAVLDGLTLHGVAGSRPRRALTATMDAAIALVLRRKD